MEKKMNRFKFKSYLLAVSMTSLISCGGGGSGGGTTPGGTTASLPADFDLFSQTGTWRMSVDIGFQNQTFDFGTVQADIDLQANQTILASIQGSGNQFIASGCDAYAPETIVDTEFDENFISDLTDGINPNCTNTVTYTKISDSNYRIQMTCGADISTDLVFTKLSASADFNFGSMSFTSTQSTDLNATSGVCGTLGDFQTSTSYTPQPNGLNLTDEVQDISSLTVMAPYNGNRISIEMDFPGAIQPGTFTVVDDISTNVNEVEIDLQSVTFGGTPDDPGFQFATSGTVTITSISQFAASGSFDITTFSGNTLVGTFSFDIQ